MSVKIEFEISELRLIAAALQRYTNDLEEIGPILGIDYKSPLLADLEVIKLKVYKEIQ